MKTVQDAASGIDFCDASAIDWMSADGVRAALECHGEHQSELESIDLDETILLLCSYFKPNDIRPVYQGICQDAGRNWRSLSLAKLKSMKTLAPEFAKACVDIVNARTDNTEPGKITVKKKIVTGGPARKFDSLYCFTKHKKNQKRGCVLIFFYKM